MKNIRKSLLVAILLATIPLSSRGEELQTQKPDLEGSWSGSVQLMPIGFKEDFNLEIKPKNRDYELILTSPMLKAKAGIPKLVVPLVHTPDPQVTTKGKISLFPPVTEIGEVTCEINYQETDGKTNGTFLIIARNANIRVDGDFGLVKKG